MQHQTLPWQAVIFDFDGVLIDSNTVKADAFAAMFSQYGKAVEAAVSQYHRCNGGMPRHEKLAHYCREYIKIEPDESTLATMAADFSKRVVDQVVAAPFIKGAMESLETLRSLSIPAFVISGTPHEEINLIVRRKNLMSYFQEVHGSPASKTEIARDIINRFSLHPQDCLFIGDALADYMAATNTGMAFLGITSYDSPVVFPEGVAVAKEVRLVL